MRAEARLAEVEDEHRRLAPAGLHQAPGLGVIRGRMLAVERHRERSDILRLCDQGKC
jgi:hypothetical protein